MKAHVIFGPPGTGKSTDLIRRMRACIEGGIPEGRIGFVSFTRAAATELAHRVGIKAGGNISTIHSMAYRLSGIIREQVLDNPKLREYAKISGVDISGANPDDADYLSDGDHYLALYNLHHAKGREEEGISYQTTYNESDRPGEMRQFIRFCEGLDKYKEANGFVDFNDMLKMALSCEAPDVDVLFIDEAQDLSPLQWNLIDYWCQFVPEVHVAGDDDQAIYVWGGADSQGMIKFAGKYNAEQVVLGQSHRIPSSVHSLASRLVERVKDRVEKEYAPRDEEGAVTKYGSVQFIQFSQDFEDTLVLYRNHSLREEIENHLIEKGIPYVVDSGKAGVMHGYAARACKLWFDMLWDWEHFGHVMMNKRDHNTLVWNVKPRIKAMIEREDIDQLKKYNWYDVLKADYRTISYIKTLMKKYGTEFWKVQPTVHLSTIHGSKGREASRVILVNGMSIRSAETMLRDPDSEYRTFYVGVTRAKERLDIISGDNAIGIL